MTKNMFYNLSVEMILEPYLTKFADQTATLKENDFDKIEVDLADRSVYARVVQSLEMYPDCAFFYQLNRANNGCYSQAQNLLYMDFGKLLSDAHESASDNTKQKAEKLKRSRCQHLIQHFLFEQGNDETKGLFVKFPGQGDCVRFIPFDKSNSMARTCRMTFLRHSLKDKMNKALMLDMDLDKVALSKLYAYRGLYLSASKRIPNSAAFPLTEQTIIVIPDQVTHITEVEDGKRTNKLFDIVTARRVADSPKEETTWEKTNEKREIQLNRFDGQGLICPEYATYINNCISPKSQVPSYSFQMRMPFAKGMLHMVDFHDLIKTHLPEDVNFESIEVKDVFGKYRNLSHAKIILTESMFKGRKWLEYHCEKNNYEDEMQYYFSKFSPATYDHALYISNVDTMLVNHGRTKLNYQFLNPMGFNVADENDDFSSLIHKHFAYSDRLRLDELEQVRSFHEEFSNVDSQYADEELIRYNEATWANVLRKNKNIMYDPKVKGMLRGCHQSRLRDTVFGRLSVKGECRFLARDLMAFCWHLLRQCYVSEKQLDTKSGNLDKIRNSVIYENKFTLPGSSLKLKNGQNAVLLRNPHLSRNEEWLSDYYPGNKLRSKYLSHLKGVLEIGYNSLANIAISGADFDGDLVKVCVEEEIVNAVKNRAPTDTNPIEIPDTGAPSLAEIKGDYTIWYDVIKRTFDSRVGQISNQAIRLGRWEYFDHLDKKNNKITPETELPTCAEACILTGIEIDAAKHGRKPNISGILCAKLPKVDKPEVDYLRGKNTIAASEKFGTKVFKTGENSYSVSTTGKSFTIHPSASQKTAPNVDRLLAFWAEKKLKEQKDKQSEKRHKTADDIFRHLHFTEASPPDESITRYVEQIMSAYNAVLLTASRDYRAEQQYKRAKYIQQIDTILEMQYDDLTDKLQDYYPDLQGTDTTVVGARNAAFEQIRSTITSWISTKNITSEAEYIALSDQLNKEFLSWIKADNWPLMDKKSKEKVLKEKFSFTPDKHAEAIALLTNFHHDGYKLLYFMVKDVVCEIYLSVSTLTAEETTEDLPDESASTEESPDSANDEQSSQQDGAPSKAEPARDNVYFKSYYQQYNDAKAGKKSKKIWQAEICKAARADLFFAVSGNAYSPSEREILLAMRYVHACRKYDRNRNFFWDIFRTEEILSGLNKKEKEPEVIHNAK